jgi:MFS family permease
VLITVLIGVAATSFPFTVFGASLPLIADDLGASESTITWVLIAPILGYAVAIPLLGKLGDLYGHRRIYIAGFAAATVIAALTSLAWDVGSLVALRTLGQVTGAATGPASMAIIMSSFPKEQRAKATGWWSTVVGASPTIGLVAGGPLIDAFGWRVLFLLQAVPAAIAVVASIAILPETKRKEGVRLDVAGAATMGLGVAFALFALNRGVTWGWESPAVRACLLLAPIALVAFVVIERRTAHPLLPPALLRVRNFNAPVSAQLFLQASYMGAYVLAPFLLADRLGYSTATVTWIMAARPAAWIVCAPIAGGMISAVGERRAAVAGTGAITASMAVLALGAAADSPVLVVVGLVLSGAGNGISRPPFASSVANAVDETDLGIASAAQNVSGQIGAAVGITVLTAIYASTGGDFALAFWVGTGISAAAVVLAWLIVDLDRSHLDDEVVAAPAGGSAVVGEAGAGPAPAPTVR